MFSSHLAAYRLCFFSVELVLLQMLNASVGFLVVAISGSVNPSLVGLSLAYVNSIGGYLQYSTRLSAEVSRYPLEKINSLYSDSQ